MQLKELIENINDHLKLEDNLKNAMNKLNEYNSDDWKKFKSNKLNGYTRNLVYKCNKFDIYIISWSKNSESPIHNHPNGGCLMKILEGSLNENIYNINTLKIKKKNNLSKNDVKYIDDTLGYHKIFNNNIVTYSIHIYSPGYFESTKYD